MKHARKDYDRIQDPAGLIPEDEPVFLIRGQDACALNVLMAYASEANRRGAILIADRVMDWLNVVRDWQRNHGSKVPDMPDDV